MAIGGSKQGSNQKLVIVFSIGLVLLVPLVLYEIVQSRNVQSQIVSIGILLFMLSYVLRAVGLHFFNRKKG